MTAGTTSWREDLNRWLTRTASSLDDFIDIRWQFLKKRFGWDGVPKIQPYIGYANQSEVWLHGRVLTNPPTDMPGDDDQWWDNIANTYQRFASDEVPNCEVEVRLGDSVHRVTSDAEGYFYVNERHDFPATSQGLWSTAALQIVNHELVSPEDSATSCQILTPPSAAQFGVISDVDDTILHTGATRLITMAKLTFLGNARTRVPLPGVAEFYQALQGTHTRDSNELNPIFYVSSSPWNLFDLLEDFLQLNNIPLGPLLLRDLGFDNNKFLKEGHEHKLEKTRRILRAYPDTPFVLIGDSGQEDANLYATAAEEFGERIKAIFIRDVDPGDAADRAELVSKAMRRVEQIGVPMHLIRDSVKAADIAKELGLIESSCFDAIRDGTAKDKERGNLLK